MSNWKKLSAKLSCNSSAPECAGVYVFFFGDSIIYIGMSGNIKLRMRSHRIANIPGPNMYDGYVQTPWARLPWDRGRFRAKYKECANYHAALELESKLIRRLYPEFNIRGNSRG